MLCNNCSRKCNVDRTMHHGPCGAGSLPRVNTYMLHKWEEPCFSGQNGTGAIFFSGCNMKCLFCQNHKLRNALNGVEYSSDALSCLFLELQSKGAHSIDLVTPTPHIGTIREAIIKAKDQGLFIPVIYNTNATECTEALKSLDGLIDIYLPDFKYCSDTLSRKYSDFEGYFDTALHAIQEMYRQVGKLCLDENGIAFRGLLIRHLVLPCCTSDSKRILSAIKANFPLDTWLSLMSQYTPTPQIMSDRFLNRKITPREYDTVLNYCISLGFTNVYTQEISSAKEMYTPEFTVFN